MAKVIAKKKEMPIGGMDGLYPSEVKKQKTAPVKAPAKKAPVKAPAKKKK